MKLLDSHCHLDLIDNMENIVSESIGDKICILTMTTTPKAFKKNKEICQNNENIKVAIGLHPQLVIQREKEIDLLLEYIKDTRYIGEVGIDLNKIYEKSINQQIRIFSKVIDSCDWYGNKVISIHCVKSIDLILEILRSNIRNISNKYILHWFTGNQTNLKDAINLGCYFSVNREMLNTKGGKNVVRSLPIDKILLETDAPFTKNIHSLADINSILHLTIQDIARIRIADEAEIYRKLEENSLRILGEI